MWQLKLNLIKLNKKFQVSLSYRWLGALVLDYIAVERVTQALFPRILPFKKLAASQTRNSS